MSGVFHAIDSQIYFNIFFNIIQNQEKSEKYPSTEPIEDNVKMICLTLFSPNVKLKL